MIQIVSDLIWLLLVVAYIASVASCIIVVLSENRNPIRSLAWVVALIFLPVIGLVFYLFFGRSMRNVRMLTQRGKRRMHEVNKEISYSINDAGLSSERRQLALLAQNIGRAPLTIDNKIDVFTSGSDKFEALKCDLRNAREAIFLQYYIFTDDNIGREIAEILMDKAREGVTVKVIYDHVGSFSVKSRFFRRLRDAGVDARPFFRVTFPTLASRINWRNHRKIVVIDYKTGYIGGMNIADRYLSGHDWRDTHFRVEGNIVSQLYHSFSIDWNFMGEALDNEPKTLLASDLRNNLGMQLVASGPTGQWNNLSLCFLRAITMAHKCIYIQTPYFLPTESLMNAMETAALANVDVRVMIPRRSDSYMLQLASFSYVSECLRTGIKVYLYEPGMIHAKMMIIDNDFVTSGSTNFDFRSLENNFECNLFVYDEAFNSRMRGIFFEDMKLCHKITLTEWQKRTRGQRVLESVVRLMAPVL